MRLCCISCGATWPDPKVTGLVYAHVCPDTVAGKAEVVDPITHEIITHVERVPVAFPRNENTRPNPDKPGEHVIVSEGLGVSEID